MALAFNKVLESRNNQNAQLQLGEKMQSHKALVTPSLSPYVGEDNSLCTISIDEIAT